MAKIVLKRLSEANKTDILCNWTSDRQTTVLGYLSDYFVSGKKVQIKVESIHTGEIIPYLLDTPDIPQAWFIVNDGDEKG